MAFKVTLLHGVAIEFTKVLEWYEEKNDLLVKELHDEFMDALDSLAANPESYGFVHKEYRNYSLKRFPYKLIFLITDNKVTVHLFLHNSRDDREFFKQL